MVDTVIYGLLALVGVIVLIGLLVSTLNSDAQERFEDVARGSRPPIRQPPPPPAPLPAPVPWLLVGGPAHGRILVGPKMSAVIWVRGDGGADHLYRGSHWRALGDGEELTFRIAVCEAGVAPDNFAEVPDLIRRLNFPDVKGRAL